MADGSMIIMPNKEDNDMQHTPFSKSGKNGLTKDMGPN